MAKLTNVALLTLAILVSGSTVFCARAPKTRTPNKPTVTRAVPTTRSVGKKTVTKAAPTKAVKKAPTKNARR